MNSIGIVGKEKLIDAYCLKPTLFFGVEGKLIECQGKNVKIESQVGGKVVNYTLKLKEELKEEIGEDVKIDKENIVSLKIEEKKEVEEKEIRKTEDFLVKLGIEPTAENIEICQILLENGLPITLDNIKSFQMSKEYLNEIIEKLDYDSITKLMKKDIDLGEATLQKVYESIDEIELMDEFSIVKFLGLKRDLSYEEAEKISVEIYGRKMGKDIYDSIIALHREKIEINKENIEKVREIVQKLHDLKNVEDTTFIKTVKNHLTVNIENLYKMKYSYDSSKLKENLVSGIYDEYSIKAETTREDILYILENLELKASEENISLVEKFILNDMDINKKNISEILNMKEALSQLRSLLDEESIAKLLSHDIDPLKEDIREIVDILKKDDLSQRIDKKDEKVAKILEKIDSLGKVRDEDLIYLLKKKEDFKIEKLKDISTETINKNSGNPNKIVDKIIRISNVINSLGELNQNTIALASKKYSSISLNSLYESEIQLNKNYIPVEPVEKSMESFIRQEYMKARENLSINIIKESISDGVEVEYMPLTELNEYIDKKLNKHEEIEKTLKEIKALRGKEYDLISLAMKNGMDMSLRQLTELNYFRENRMGLGNGIEKLKSEREHINNEELRQAISQVEEKAKEVSRDIKNGDAKIKGEYKEFIRGLENLANSFESGEDREKREKYREIEESLKLQKALSKEDLILQFPILMDYSFENLQVIIPNLNRGINKENMNFILNLNTSNLGNVKFNLEVKGKDILVKFIAHEEGTSKLLENKSILEEAFDSIGYNLKELSFKVEEINKNDKLLKTVDTAI